MAQQKSPMAQLNELKRKAERYDNLTETYAELKTNFTAVKSSLCHFGKNYFDMVVALRGVIFDDNDDESQESSIVGVRANHLATLKENCKGIEQNLYVEDEATDSGEPAGQSDVDSSDETTEPVGQQHDDL